MFFIAIVHCHCLPANLIAIANKTNLATQTQEITNLPTQYLFLLKRNKTETVYT